MGTSPVKRAIAVSSLLGGLFFGFAPVGATGWEERSPASRAAYTTAAVVANVVPGVSALVAPQCLTGYVACKLAFAALSVVVAAESLVMSGGADARQPRAILERGFGGDWLLTGRHVAGDDIAEPLPEAGPRPPASATGGRAPATAIP